MNPSPADPTAQVNLEIPTQEELDIELAQLADELLEGSFDDADFEPEVLSGSYGFHSSSLLTEQNEGVAQPSKAGDTSPKPDGLLSDEEFNMLMSYDEFELSQDKMDLSEDHFALSEDKLDWSEDKSEPVRPIDEAPREHSHVDQGLSDRSSRARPEREDGRGRRQGSLSRSAKIDSRRQKASKRLLNERTRMRAGKNKTQRAGGRAPGLNTPVKLILLTLPPSDAQQLLEDLEPIKVLLRKKLAAGTMTTREANRWLQFQVIQGITSKRRMGLVGWLLRITGAAKLWEILLANWPIA